MIVAEFDPHENTAIGGPARFIRAPRVLQRAPALFQEQALVRIGQLRLPAGHIEKQGIETRDPLQETSPFAVDFIRFPMIRIIKPGVVPPLFRDPRDRARSPREVFPERLRIRGARETARHTDDRDYP